MRSKFDRKYFGRRFYIDSAGHSLTNKKRNDKFKEIGIVPFRK